MCRHGDDLANRGYHTGSDNVEAVFAHASRVP